MELLVSYKGPDREDPAFHILVRWCNYWSDGAIIGQMVQYRCI